MAGELTKQQLGDLIENVSNGQYAQVELLIALKELQSARRKIARLEHPSVCTIRVVKSKVDDGWVAYRACDVTIQGMVMVTDDETPYGLGATKAEAVAALVIDVDRRGFTYTHNE